MLWSSESFCSNNKECLCNLSISVWNVAFQLRHLNCITKIKRYRLNTQAINVNQSYNVRWKQSRWVYKFRDVTYCAIRYNFQALPGLGCIIGRLIMQMMSINSGTRTRVDAG